MISKNYSKKKAQKAVKFIKIHVIFSFLTKMLRKREGTGLHSC